MYRSWTQDQDLGSGPGPLGAGPIGPETLDLGPGPRTRDLGPGPGTWTWDLGSGPIGPGSRTLDRDVHPGASQLHNPANIVDGII